MWWQFPPNLKKNPTQNYVAAVPAESQNLKKNPPPNYVAAVLLTSINK
jgi:hypothetical protein